MDVRGLDPFCDKCSSEYEGLLSLGRSGHGATSARPSARPFKSEDLRTQGLYPVTCNRNPKPDDLQQSKRFMEAAKEAGADDWQTAFEEAFAKLDVRKGVIPKPRAGRSRPSGK